MNKKIFIDSTYDNYYKIYNQIKNENIENIICLSLLNHDFTISLNSLFNEDNSLTLNFIGNHKIIMNDDDNFIPKKNLFKIELKNKNNEKNIFHNRYNIILIYEYNILKYERIEKFISCLDKLYELYKLKYKLYMIGNLFGLCNNDFINIFYSKKYKKIKYINTIELYKNSFIDNLKKCKINKNDIKLLKSYNYYISNNDNFPRIYSDNLIFISCCENDNYIDIMLNNLLGDNIKFDLLNNTSFIFKKNTKIIFNIDYNNIKKGDIGYIEDYNNNYIIVNINNKLFNIKALYSNKLNKEYLPFNYYWISKPENIYLFDKKKSYFLISLSYINRYGYLYDLFTYLNFKDNFRIINCHMLNNKSSIFYQNKINNYKMRLKFLKNKI